MRSLEQIERDNKHAVEQGFAEPGQLFGTDKVAPILYDVVGDSVSPGTVYEQGKTIAQLAHWRQSLNLGSVKLVKSTT